MNSVILQKTKVGLLENGKDSVRTALLHFLDRQIDNRGEYHHTKWVNVCAYHAAECISNLFLLENDPENNLIMLKDSEYRFPHLDQVLPILKGQQFRGVLSDSERMLLKMYGKLSENRHKFMHRIAPDNADMSVAAISILGTLRMLKNHKGILTADLLDTSPPVEADIASVIKTESARSYERYIAQVMKEEKLGNYFEHCPNCDLQTVHESECWACFEVFEMAFCKDCDESTIYMSWLPASGELAIGCKDCGANLPIS